MRVALSFIFFLASVAARPKAKAKVEEPSKPKGNATQNWAPLLRELANLGKVQREQVERLVADDETGFLMLAAAANPPEDSGEDETRFGAEGDVVLTLPRSYLLGTTALREGPLEHFLHSPKMLKHMSKQEPKIQMPDSFVFVMWFFFQMHAKPDDPHADPLWRAWIDWHLKARTGENALHRWKKEVTAQHTGHTYIYHTHTHINTRARASAHAGFFTLAADVITHLSSRRARVPSSQELAVLEEKRIVEGAENYRDNRDKMYDALVMPLAGFFPEFFDVTRLTRDHFHLALAATASQLVDVDGVDGLCLVPLPMRMHPEANAGAAVRYQEVEQQLMAPSGTTRSRTLVQLVAQGGLRRGRELLGWTQRHNDDMLLMSGYMWDDIAAAAVPLRMSLVFGMVGAEEERGWLLEQAKLNATQDWSLTHGKLPDKLLLWSRIMLGTNEEVLAANNATAPLQSQQSRPTEDSVYSNIWSSLEGVRANFDHDVEEDDFILGDTKRALPPRELLAVRNRRLSKLVLDGGKTSIAKLLDTDLKAEQKAKATNSYSTKTERAKEAKKKQKRAKKREAVKRSRQAKEAE